MGSFGYTDGNCVDEYVLFSAVSCIVDTLFGENYLTRATQRRENAEKCTYASVTIPYSYQCSHNF